MSDIDDFEEKLDDASKLDLSDLNFRLAYEAIDNPNHGNIFITGGAGTGKSVILSSYYHRLRSRKKNVVVVSPTGVSADMLRDKGLPATTIHSMFQLPPHPIFEQKIELSNRHQKILGKLDYILIDEVSMVSPSLFDHIMWILNEVGFKGRIILFGDPLQLSPVVKLDDENVFNYYVSHEYIKSRYDRPQFYSAVAYKELSPVVYTLTAIYRQDNKEFATVLSHVRKGDETDEDLALINSRVMHFNDFSLSHQNLLYLATTNRRVDVINRAYEKTFEGQSHFMTYTSESTGSMKRDKEDEFRIYKGEQVMCIHNNLDEGYQNGMLGIVEDFDEDAVYINVKGETKKVVFETWTDYKVVYDSRTRQVEAEECGTYKQIGCKPTFATTVHKAQGLTLDAVYFDMSEYFLPIAAVYLALSRVRTLEGLGLSRPIGRRDIKVDEDVKNFYRRLALVSSSSLLNADEFK